MKRIIFALVLMISLFILGFIVTMMTKSPAISKIIELKTQEFKNTDFKSLVALIGNNYSQEQIVVNATTYKIRYFVTRPGELEDFRIGYTGKIIDKVKPGEALNSVEIVGTVDYNWLFLYFGKDFKIIVDKKK